MKKKYDNQLENIRHGYIVSGATIGLIVAGLAPATLFGYSLYRALMSINWEWFAAGIAGISLAITMEVIGGVSAHVVQTTSDNQRRVIGIMILAIYTIIGLVYMAFFEPNSVIQRTGVMAYLVAPMLYFAVAMLNATAKETITIDQKQKQQNKLDLVRLRFEMEQEAADRQAERDFKAKQAEINARIKMNATEKAVQLKLEKERTKQAQVSGQNQDSSLDITKTDWRHFTDTEKLRILDFTPDEIVEKFNVTRKTANRWILNAEKSVLKLSNKVAQNGNVK